MKHSGKTFTGQTLKLDGAEFIECRLDDCDLTYAGGLPPSIVDCTIRNCRVTFEGSALNTLALLKGMASPGSAFRQFVRTYCRWICIDRRRGVAHWRTGLTAAALLVSTSTADEPPQFAQDHPEITMPSKTRIAVSAVRRGREKSDRPRRGILFYRAEHDADDRDRSCGTI